MKAHRLRLMALSSVPLLAFACDGESAEPRGFELAVAPLSLPGIGQACYDITVYNAAGGVTAYNASPSTIDVVWHKGDASHTAGNATDAICSGQYGNGAGGGVTYIGTCDADADANVTNTRNGSGGFTAESPWDADGERINSVTLWVDGLYSTGTPGAGTYIDPTGANGWQNPCPNGCTIDFVCEENADVFVEFNLTIMRDAQQGFFDIAVNFEDIFCSAKFDSCGGTPVADQPVPPRVVRDYVVRSGSTEDLVLHPFTGTIETVDERLYAFKLSNREFWVAAKTAVIDQGQLLTNANLYVSSTASSSEIGDALAVKLGGTGTEYTLGRVKKTLDTKHNELLFSPDGSERQHTAVAALACTAGPDSSAVGTELVFTEPTVTCGGGVKFVIPSLDLTDAAGAGGNHEISAASPNEAKKLRYALYYDQEDLTCPPQAGADGRYYYVDATGARTYYARKTGTNGAWELYNVTGNTAVDGETPSDDIDSTPPAAFSVGGTSYPLDDSCNKVYYNIALNIEHLAQQGLQGCAFSWGASAIEAGSTDVVASTGNLADPAGVYPAINYGGILLTGKTVDNVTPSQCSQNPLNGDWSGVQTFYVKGTNFADGQVRQLDYKTDGLTVTEYPIQ